MATYAIGDIQGCYDELMALLDRIGFSDQDQLWFAGDLVNRGPKSLEVLRFVKSLGLRARTVLGNHDLHLLAVHYGMASGKRKDTLVPVLEAPDREELMHWLRHQPLLIDDKALGYVITHAGIPPIWTLKQAREFAGEVEQVLQGTLAEEYFRHMYGNQPDHWRDSVKGWDRLRLITNYLTRMRFVSPKGKLDFSANGGLETQPEGYHPWYEVERSKPIKRTQLFGHWAALGETGRRDTIALDTGCVWGGALTALRLEDGELFSCGCAGHLDFAS
ncbi:symmetrical bis(5'-nucleosyl)-tetraphosphatase [Marinobacterium lutimaris]|uniref:Bis(5'-nucleosyl)-tetraphosphatase, symmetrical n=1 Tax=Marinobacterium lutimaris TaxID=568106 RepID=A0A1H6B7N2_9GAMM|nr:symmetrical bis(5'-nucleosyl)-tetraphosphatase [Marinobacterium lutimaris]SEG56818.1 Bis(5'nucleosyl)-tetraphosphatase, ApaH [Marinobacterium lutimaris]